MPKETFTPIRPEDYGFEPYGQIGIPRKLLDLIPSNAEPYFSTVKGDCLAPLIEEGDMVLCYSHRTPKPGDYIVLHFHTGETPLKRMVTDLNGMPILSSPGSSVQLHTPIKVCQTNPPQEYSVRPAKLRDVHIVVARARKHKGKYEITPLGQFAE